MIWIKITNPNENIVTYLLPMQITYVQKYERGDGPLRTFGEIIVPGGTFVFYDQAEAEAAWKLLRIE